MTHEYTQDLSTAHWEIKIDPVANYGYFERNSDGEGGSLWFENGELVDYDGVFELSQSVVQALRGAGYILGKEYDPDPPAAPKVNLERRRHN